MFQNKQHKIQDLDSISLNMCAKKKCVPKEPNNLRLKKEIYLLKIAKNHERGIEEAVNMA